MVDIRYGSETETDDDETIAITRLNNMYYDDDANSDNIVTTIHDDKIKIDENFYPSENNEKVVYRLIKFRYPTFDVTARRHIATMLKLLIALEKDYNVSENIAELTIWIIKNKAMLMKYYTYYKLFSAVFHVM